MERGKKEHITALTERKISRMMRKVADVQFPSMLYSPMCRMFCWLARIPNYEIPAGNHEPRSLNRIFTRPSQSINRKHRDSYQIVSPVDGVVTMVGRLQPNNTCPNEPIIKAKQSQFKLDKDLIDRVHPNTNIYYVGIYLSPSNNHHFNSAANWTVNKRTHYPGFLHSVRSDHRSRKLEANERVSYSGKWVHGRFSMTMIGAFNVGSIKVHRDPELHTNNKNDDKFIANRNSKKLHSKDLQITSLKNEPFGYFRLGSFIVLTFEAPRTFEFKCSENDKIEKGAGIGSIPSNNHILHRLYL